MRTSIKFLRGWILLLFVLATAISANAQTITLTSSDININSACFVDDDGCPGIETGQCNFVGATLQGGVYGNQFANDCGYRRVENQAFQCYTSINVNHFYALNGAGTNSVTVNWLNFETAWHDIEMGSPYVANNNSVAAMDLVLDVAGLVNGTKIKVYYAFEIFAGAVGEAEGAELDVAAVNPALLLNNKNLILQGGFNLNLNAGPGPGQIKRVGLSGFFNHIVGQPITLSISTIQNVAIVDPGIVHRHLQTLMYWKDFSTAEFGGSMTLSLDPVLPPVSPTPPAFSEFSVDIGSASELSDPMANGTEFFDPGDAYQFFGPALPPGGADGTIDDDTFFPIDPHPNAPDPAIPAVSAAPVQSGLPLGGISETFFDMDGLDKLGFVVQPDGTVQTAPADACLLPIKHLFVSVDDDEIHNYLSPAPSFGAPANSTSFSVGTEYGTTAGKDELFERLFFLTPFFPTLTFGVSSEQMIHPSLGPDPLPGLPVEDDDIDALNLEAVASGCNEVYFSADHEATGVDLNGDALDPGIIYRSTAGGFVPAVTLADLGLLPGTDINAFEFARVTDPINPFGMGNLAMLFSTDLDDPSTSDDESGGLEPDLIYQSFMDGSFTVLDSLHYDENVDAISILNQSLFPLTQATTCNSYNFTAPATGLTANVTPTGVKLEWDQYPFSTVCQIAGNKVTNPNDVKFLVNSSPGNTPPFKRFISLSQLQPSTTYRVKVRCGCQLQGAQHASPFTGYINFTTPGPLPPPFIYDGDIFAEELSFSIYPNPSSAFITLNFNGNASVSSVRITDMSGREILSTRSSAFGEQSGIRLDVSGLSPGMYIVEVSEGIRLITEKLLIE